MSYGWQIKLGQDVARRWDLDFQTAASITEHVIRAAAKYHSEPAIAAGERLPARNGQEGDG